MSDTASANTATQPPKLTAEQITAWMQGMKAEIDELKKAQIVVPSVTANVGDGYCLQMNIRGYDEAGREVMWNLRGKTLEEFDKVFTARAANINKLQSIRPIKQEQAAPTNSNGGGEEVPTCAIHHKPMAHVQGAKGMFWSCHEKLEDGTYCPYKPGKK